MKIRSSIRIRGSTKFKKENTVRTISGHGIREMYLKRKSLLHLCPRMGNSNLGTIHLT